MTCEKICELMMEYVSGELDKATADEIKTHVELCDECRREYEFALGMSEAINNAQFDAPKELHGRIMTAVANEKRRQRRARLIRNLTAIGASAAAFVIVINVILSNSVKDSVGKAPNAPSDEQNGAIVLDSDNVFDKNGEAAFETVELSAATVNLFVGEWSTSLDDGRSATMYINEDNSVVVCIQETNGREIYYDGMLEFTKDGITLSQSDGNVNCRAVIDAVISNGRLYFDIVSGSTPWRTVT